MAGGRELLKTNVLCECEPPTITWSNQCLHYRQAGIKTQNPPKAGLAQTFV